MNTAVYSALGRIRSLAVCYSGLLSEPIGTNANRQMPQLRSLISFCRENKIELHIFYDCEQTADSPVSDNGIHYYPAPQGDSLGLCWAQDMFHYFPSGAYTFTGGTRQSQENGIPTWIGERLQAIYPSITIENAGAFFPGGNALTGYHRGEPYLLVGSSVHCNLEDERLALLSGIQQNRITRLPVVKDQYEVENFFHLDLYITIAGKTSPAGPNPEEQEIILVAQSYGPNPEFAEALDHVAEKIRNENFFTPLRLPCIVIEGGSGTIIYSYNNCLVENYFEEGSNSRVLNFYLPSYQRSIQEEYDKLNTNEARITFEHSVHTATYELLEKSELMHAPDDLLHPKIIRLKTELNQLRTLATKHGFELKAAPVGLFPDDVDSRLDSLVLLAEALTRKTLEGINATRVYFIEGNFRERAFAMGSLHCMVKVLERDQVTEE